jgi:hypothetical protein
VPLPTESIPRVALNLPMAGLPHLHLATIAPTLVTLVAPTDDTVARSELDVPIRPRATVDDTTLFEMPDGSLGYLPRYRLAKEVVGNAERYRVAVHAEPPGAIVEFFLEPAPASGLDMSSGPRVIDHTITAQLVYQPSRGAETALDVELHEQGGLQCGRVRLGSLEQVDQVITAMSADEGLASVRVARLVPCAVEVDVPPQLPPRLPRLPNFPRPLPADRFVDPTQRTPVVLPLALRRRLGDDIDLPTFPDPDIVRPTPTHEDPPPSPVPPPPPPPEPRYRRVTNQLDQEVPFSFDEERHGYVYGGLTPTGGGIAEFTLRRVGDHHYFQDPRNRHHFYFLPDRYELGREATGKCRLQLTIGAAADDPEGDEVILSFFAVPHVDRARLAAAAAGLARPEWVGNETPVLLPLAFVAWDYFLRVPGGELAQRPRQPGPGNRGFTDAVRLTRRALTEAWNGMVDGRALPPLGGHIEVQQLGTEVSIPFVPRLSDIGGAGLFAATAAAQADGTVSVVLTNLIESTVRVDGLGCSLAPSDGSAPVTTEIIHLQAGTAVPPGESLTIACRPASAIGGDVDVLLDLSDVTIEPDARAVLQTAMDASVVQTAFQVRFAAVIPDASITSVNIEVEGHSDLIVLTPAQPQLTVEIQRPFASVLLGEPAPTQVAYAYTVVRQRSIDPTVRASTTGGFVGITVPATPPAAVTS